ncbi:MAG: rhomboid family intramembrane serine protease [bacterium]|nr:rhomboid family intramembrane serine protease [bacterium]
MRPGVCDECSDQGHGMYFFYFFPLGLDRPRRRPPVLTALLAGVMLVAFLWLRYAPYLGPTHPWNLVFFPGYGAPWTVVTALFLHASWFHLAGNLLYLGVFGPPLEDRLGSVRMLVYFLIIGVGGNLVHGAVASAGLFGQAGLGVLGASGALAGLLSFSLVRLYGARVTVGWWVFAPLAGQNRAGRTHVPIAVAALLWLALQVVQAATATETGATTSFGAHLGGFAMGLFLALALGHLAPARMEAARARAEGYFKGGELHAAVGAWSEYLELCPADEEARLARAHLQIGTGQWTPAAETFRDVFRSRVGDGQADAALQVYREADRAGGLRLFAPEDLARAAYYFEKQGNHAAALDAYRNLYFTHPDHPEGHRALVRVIVLHHGRVRHRGEARRFLEEAQRRLPPGGWRDFLEREFRLSESVGDGVPVPTGPGSPGGR